MRRILVGIKRVIDYNVRVRVRPDGTGVVTDGVKMSANPFDSIALEEALRLRERGEADEVVAVSVGPNESQQQLRDALAMGADRAILVKAEPPSSRRPSPACCSNSRVARIRGWCCSASRRSTTIATRPGRCSPRCGTVRRRLRPRRSRSAATVARVTREVDAGLETIEVDLPAVCTTDLRLNEPRYIKLPDIMKAKKKPLDVVELAALGVDAAPLVKVVKFDPPPQRQKGVIVKDAAELVAALKQKGLA